MIIATQTNSSSNNAMNRGVADLPQGVKFRRISVEEYHAMARAGILSEDDAVELLEGWLVHKITKNPPHTATTRYIRAALEKCLPAGYFVDSQEPITLSDSEPEPDVFVVRGTLDDYTSRHPYAYEVVLVVEVADSSLVQDRSTKKRVYASAGIPVYWIANLLEDQNEVYSDPSGPVSTPIIKTSLSTLWLMIFRS
ncbi:MAG: Uma2 family endonuclease [Caldilineaceae bacterium]